MAKRTAELATRTVTGLRRRLGVRSATAVRLLTYHEVVGAGERCSDPFNQIAVDRLETQIRLLRAAGYAPCSVGEAVAALEQGRAGWERQVGLTFDDGLAEHATRVLPLLARLGARATFYVVTGPLVSDEVDRRHLSRRQLLELHEGGMEIGSHTRSHPLLARLTRSEKEAEIGGSVRDLESLLGGPPQSFAFPYGEPASFDQEALDVVRQCGFRTAVTTEIGSNTADTPRLRLRRIPVYGHDGDAALLAKVEGHYDWVGRAQGAWLRAFPPHYARRRVGDG